MDRFEEMPRLEKIRNAIQRFVVDEERTKQSLLGLDIVGRNAIQRRLIRSELARSRIQRCHQSSNNCYEFSLF
jgi:hypothetical protein